MVLPAFARGTLLLQQSINTSYPPGPQQPSLRHAAAVGKWDIQADGHHTISHLAGNANTSYGCS